MTQRVVAYVIIGALTIFTIGASFSLSLPAEQLDPTGFKAQPFFATLFAAASYQLSWSIYVSDYSRYLPQDRGIRASFWWTFAGAFVGGTWMMLVGTFAAALAPKSDVAAAMKQAADSIFPGFGTVLLLVGLCGLVMITTLNAYGASLTLLCVPDTLQAHKADRRQTRTESRGRRSDLTILAFNASGNFVTQFGELLTLLLYLLPPGRRSTSWTSTLSGKGITPYGRFSIPMACTDAGIGGDWVPTLSDSSA